MYLNRFFFFFFSFDFFFFLSFVLFFLRLTAFFFFSRVVCFFICLFSFFPPSSFFFRSICLFRHTLSFLILASFCSIFRCIFSKIFNNIVVFSLHFSSHAFPCFQNSLILYRLFFSLLFRNPFKSLRIHGKLSSASSSFFFSPPNIWNAPNIFPSLDKMLQSWRGFGRRLSFSFTPDLK